MSVSYWLQNHKKELEERRTINFPKDKLLLALDFDGVYTKPQKAKARVINDLGYDLIPEQMDKEIAIEAMHKQKPHLTKEKIVRDYHFAVKSLYSKNMDLVPADEGLISLMNDFHNSKYDIFIVTSRDSTKEHPEVQALSPWLKKYGANISGLINTSNTPKKEILSQMKPLIFIDDSVNKLYELFEDPQTCENLSSDLKNTTVGLYYNEGNKLIKPKGLIKSINNLDELNSLINDLSNNYN